MRVAQTRAIGNHGGQVAQRLTCRREHGFRPAGFLPRLLQRSCFKTLAEEVTRERVWEYLASRAR